MTQINAVQDTERLMEVARHALASLGKTVRSLVQVPTSVQSAAVCVIVLKMKNAIHLLDVFLT